ncbi:uncharacterized protein LTR77_003621 [Saxophila tyrrhenica]|uniref:Enoyl reductase (ER) domain-containing protein n=1 Tax=Saxophila tyrrhenica TaxID=1690608 RepID=A0AAV9PIH3_9PEZI|nr:hypothetical protein LTR77_003621 [Saxophila tyrrhenica]
MKAIKATTLGHAEIVEVPEPEVKANTILVRPSYVGINPCDHMVTDYLSHWHQDQILGCDYSGTVEEVGSDVETTLKPGDKVFGPLAAGAAYDHSRGAFGELLPAYGDLCFAKPTSISEAGAASLGIALSTIAVSFYSDFGLPLPDENPESGRGKPFFVYGGSTTTGLLAIQFAKLSGFRVLTVCSPKNFELVKSRGADEAYDYHDLEDCAKEIKVSVGDSLKYAYCCVTSVEAPKLCAEVLTPTGAKFVTIAGPMPERGGIYSHFTFGQSVMAESYKTFAGRTPQTAERKELGLRVWRMAVKLLEEGKLKPPPLEVREGLEGALQGIADLREGKVSGKKIVSRMGL